MRLIRYAICLWLVQSAFGPEAVAAQSLTQIFNSTFYTGCVNATTDSGTETFPAGRYSFMLIGRYGVTQAASFGWYASTAPTEYCQIFSTSDAAGVTRQVSIPVEFGIRGVSFGQWSSQPSLNSDGFDHIRTFSHCYGAGYTAMGMEDQSGGGDRDFNDLVLYFWREGDEVACGTRISTSAGSESSPNAFTDNAGGAFVVWSNSSGAPTGGVYIQHVASSGVIDPGWPSSGRAVKAQALAGACPDSLGGALVLSVSGGTYTGNAYLQRVSSAGANLWGNIGASVCLGTVITSSLRVVPVGDGGGIVVWGDARRELSGYDIYAQRVSATGQPLWGANGVLVASNYPNLWNAVADGHGGVVIAWNDLRNAETQSDIYAQRLSSLGGALWGVGGIPVCRAVGNQSVSALINDLNNGVIVAWADSRSGLTSDIYAQRIADDGVARWLTDGVPVVTAPENQDGVRLASDGAGGFIAAWTDWRFSNQSFTTSAVFADRIDSLGVSRWSVGGELLSVAYFGASAPAIKVDASGALITWRDPRAGAANIYRQFVDRMGQLVLASGGVPLCGTGTTEQAPSLVAAAGYGTFIFWSSGRTCVAKVYHQLLQPALADVPSSPIEDAASFTMSARPNPTRGGAWIVWERPGLARAGVDVIDASGRKLRELKMPSRALGDQSRLYWDGTDRSGAKVPAGVYWLRPRKSGGTGGVRIVVIH